MAINGPGANTFGPSVHPNYARTKTKSLLSSAGIFTAPPNYENSVKRAPLSNTYPKLQTAWSGWLPNSASPTKHSTARNFSSFLLEVLSIPPINRLLAPSSAPLQPPSYSSAISTQSPCPSMKTCARRCNLSTKELLIQSSCAKKIAG